MNFSEALEELKAGRRMRRSMWTNHSCVYLVKNRMNNLEHLEYRNLSNCIMYAASSQDLLAMDWEVLI